MDDERRTIGVEQRRRTWSKGNTIGCKARPAKPVNADREVRRVSGVRASGIIQTMLAAKRIVVISSRSKRSGAPTLAQPGGVKMNSVRTDRQIPQLSFDVDDVICILP